MLRRTPLKRTAFARTDKESLTVARKPIKARRSQPRRGRVNDPEFMAFVAELGCMISGRPATIHHVRRFGEPKSDRRIVPLAPEFHLIQHGPQFSIEALGKEKFEARYGVDLEAAIVRLNEQYERESYG